MITLKGESILMNNLFKETRNYIKYLAVGDDDTTPNYSNTSLNNEISRTEATIKYATSSKAVVVSGDFDVDKIENACEIGVITSQGDLLSHDLFNSLPSGYDSTIHLEYRLSLDALHKVISWKTTRYSNVYVCIENDTVVTVYEKSTNAGYTPMSSIDNVVNTQASFYYDSGSRQLFIHTSNDLDPANLDIHILTR